MNQMKYEVVVIGGGPAGLSAALAAKKNGAESVLIIERDKSLGGILQQCIHPGFGLSYFGQELTGPEYASLFIEEIRKNNVDVLLNSMVLSVEDNSVICINQEDGIVHVEAKSIVLNMGCRERTRMQIQIPGTRPAGVYTAGTAQRLINRQNEMVGRKVVILGSGDIGMIMARRLTLEGAKVVAVVEIMDYLAGLTRNKVQCLEDFNIPLYLSHTITKIEGNERVTGVYVAEVDSHKKVIPDTTVYYECDTVLLSVGLIPENELTKAAGIKMNPITNGPEINQFQQTSCPSVFASGNVVHVNDLVDNVSRESATAGASAALYAQGKLPMDGVEIPTIPGENVRYVCPQRIRVVDSEDKVSLFFRAMAPQRGVRIRVVTDNGDLLLNKKAIKVNPGEMETVVIEQAKLKNASAIKVEVIKD